MAATQTVVTTSHLTQHSTKTMLDDNENVLDLADQTQRPWDVALHQQRIPAWNPILHPVWCIVTFYMLAAICIPTGYKLKALSNDVVELRQTYDSAIAKTPNNNPDCAITKPNENKTCVISFVVPKYMSPPVLVHYQLENFHQNHRKYYQSRDDSQLLGQVGGQTSLSASNCDPLNQLKQRGTNQTISINPCGLIANSFFNDVIALNPGSKSLLQEELVMNEHGIAWSSDRTYMFAQPNGFNYAPCANQSACDTCCQDETDPTTGQALWSCQKPYVTNNGTCYGYYYPNDNTTQYLYETYPDVISPLEGVNNEHFIVWMRIAALPTFRKLYGYIDQPIAAGTVLNFTIRSNYLVSSFKGSKTLILSTNNKFGGRNDTLGPIFYGVGYFCLLAAVFFTIKHVFKPRKIADVRYLHFKQE
jgi:hypothetical protein